MDLLPTDRLGTGPRLALVHGFTQTRQSWRALAAALANDHEVVTVDVPGHGEAADVRAGPLATGRLLAEAAGPATFVGYSMGGRLCLHTALHEPDAVRGLVVVSATGGIDDPTERAARRAADDLLADRVERIGVPAFVDEWLSQPLFASLSDDDADRPSRLANTSAGLASSLRLVGTGRQRPLWDELGEVAVPVLVLAGQLDDKFLAAGERLVEAIGPNARFEIVPDAGHSAHIERPEAFLRTLRDWLAEHDL